MESSDDDVVGDSNVATNEVSSSERPAEKVTLVDLITSTVPPTTVVTTAEMMSENVKSRESDMEMTTDMEDGTNETTTGMSESTNETTTVMSNSDEE